MTVLGPLTAETSDSMESQVPLGRHNDGLRSILGRSIVSIFNCVEWNSLRTMISVFGSVEHCLKRIGISSEVPAEDLPYYEAGARAIKGWEFESIQMSESIEKLRYELEMTEEKCKELANENSELRQKCNAYSEAGTILEQDRQQLQSLLTDKCKLIEENRLLEREITSLQELLEYATVHSVQDYDDPSCLQKTSDSCASIEVD